MFVSLNQFWYFSESLFIGVAVGLALEFFYLATLPLSYTFLRHIIAFFEFMALGAAYYFASTYFRFPSFRAYMAVGVLLGFVLEKTTVRKTVAKFCGKWYNAFVKFLRRKVNDRRKNAKTRRGRYGSGNRPLVRTANGARVSTVRIKRKKQRT